MKTNFSIVPQIVKSNPQTAYRLACSFFKNAKIQHLPRNFENYNHMKNLALVYMKLTPLCNLRCVMCGQRGDKGVLKGEFAKEEAKTIPSLDVYKRFVDEVSISAKPVFYLWGGEPFLYPDLFELIRYIKSKNLVVSINTNGTWIEKYAEQIVRDQWNCLFVSLDGFKDVNDSMRGAGSYDRVIKGFEALNREKEKQKSYFPYLSVVTTVTKKNYEYLDQLTEASKAFNLDWHIINLGTYTNDSVVARQKKIMKEELDTDIDCLEGYNTGYNIGIDGHKLHAILQNIHKTDFGHPIITVPVLNPEKTTTYYADLETPVRNHCIVPWCQANINYNGDVHFCADYPDYIIGNLKDTSFTEIYNGERANKFRKVLDSQDDGLLPGCLRCYQNMLFGKKITGY